jgi:hypothetical protein
MVMTQQYLAGELSVLLARLQTVTSDPAARNSIALLRGEAETLPVTALPSVTVRALRLIDVLCWASVDRGDVVAFRRQCQAGAELFEFGVCAGLLDKR